MLEGVSWYSELAVSVNMSTSALNALKIVLFGLHNKAVLFVLMMTSQDWANFYAAYWYQLVVLYCQLCPPLVGHGQLGRDCFCQNESGIIVPIFYWPSAASDHKNSHNVA